MFRRLVAVAAGGLATVLATAAIAAPTFTSGSFSIAAFTSSTTNVTTTTIFPLTTNPVFIGSPVDDFALVVLPPTLALPAGSLDLNLIGCCNWTDAGLGSFVGTVAPVQTQTTGFPGGSATWDVVGQYTVGADFDNAGEVLTANMTWSMTQTGGPTDATSISATFHSPRIEVPEPATLMLMGIGLAGLGLTRRRKA